MTEIHFLELAACIGDHEARAQLRETWGAIHTPSDIEVTAFLERHLGSDGPFTEHQRLEGRARLIALMVEQSLGHQLDWDEEDFWGEEELDMSADGPESGNVAWCGEPTVTLTWRENPEISPAWLENYGPIGGGGLGPWMRRPACHRFHVDGSEIGLPVSNLVALRSLPTVDGPVMFGNDGVSVYIQRPPGISAAGLRLGESDYALDPVTGIVGVERIVGLTVSGMLAFFQGHGSNNSSLSWKD